MEVYMVIRSFRIAGWLLFLTIIVFLSGCAHKAAVEPPTGSYLEDIYSTANTNPDVDMFGAAMPPYLQYTDSLLGPDSPESLLYRLSGAYYGYAFCFLEDTDKKEASVNYLKGREYTFNELKRYRMFYQIVTYETSIIAYKQALTATFDKKNIQALYWTAMNWAGWINVNLDNPDARADLPKAEAMLEFINTIDESYNNGSVHATLGVLYANRSKADGGDPEKAREEFDKAFTYSGNSIFLMHVMYARYYACQIQDRELYKKTLTTVLETPSNTYADKTFINEVARRKAKVLMDNIDKYFKAAEPKKGGEAATTPQQ
jgi:tetratricopeptide (TPR) repeat protein